MHMHRGTILILLTVAIFGPYLGILDRFAKSVDTSFSLDSHFIASILEAENIVTPYACTTTPPFPVYCDITFPSVLILNKPVLYYVISISNQSCH